MSELAAEGIAVFVSSGDSGSAGCQELEGMTPQASVEYPSSDPNVVAVGGTTTPLGANGRLLGPITNWGQQTQSGGAAGGGLSTDFQTPTFQSAQTASAAICTMRCVPDVALDADPFSGAAVLYDSGPGLGGPSEESRSAARRKSGARHGGNLGRHLVGVRTGPDVPRPSDGTRY